MTTRFRLALRMASTARWTMPCGVRGAGAGGVFGFGEAEENDAGDAELFDFAAFFEELIDGLLRDAGHGADGLADFGAGADEHRVDEAGRRDARFANEIAESFRAAQAARAMGREAHP